MTENEEWIIRPFAEEDAGAVSELIIENLEKVNVMVYGASTVKKLAKQYTPAHILKYAGKGSMFVAVSAAGLVGTITLEEERVRNLFVRVDCQGHGIGEKLVGFIEELARQKGLEKLTLQADLSAAEFYSRLGYARCGERLQLIRSARIKMVAMEKAISV
jgi:N-acetylglutamate synthase-like GNAT family acetyltransferase